MYLAEQLRYLRKIKKLSQGDMEKRTGLLRCYISRVENGHTVPSVETLVKFAQALQIPIYHLLYQGEGLTRAEDSSPRIRDWASTGKGYRTFTKFRQALSRMSEADRELFLEMTKTFVRARQNHRK